ncbi:VCBS repeat-containing protein [bacterium]|nr:VCBS repeat-containing protein [bacterium]
MSGLFRPDRPHALIPDVTDGYGVAFRDLTGDRRPDLFIVCFRSLNRLLVNQGPDSGFSDATIQSRLGGNLSPRGIRNLELGVLAADLGNTGRPDLVVTGWTGTTRLYRNEGRGVFRDRTGYLHLPPDMDANACAAADVDNDGRLDLFFTDEHATNRLMKNRGNGSFLEAGPECGLASGGGSQGAAFCDADRDGDMDLAVANWFRPADLYRNNGKGRFSRVDPGPDVFRTPSMTNGALFADMDNDGRPDLLFSDRDGGVRLLKNGIRPGDPVWSFVDVTARSGLTLDRPAYGLAAADLDQDGWLDLLVTCIGPDVCFLNNGDGTFRPAAEERLPSGGSRGYSTGAATADWDGDGDLDLCVANKDTFAWLFTNPVGNGRWMAVRVHGVRSNRDAVGTRVELFRRPSAGGGPAFSDSLFLAVRDVSAGGGYLSASDPTVHFGLPFDGPVDIRVVFPSGRTVTRAGLSSGRVHDVNEYPGTERSLIRAGRWLERTAGERESRLRIGILLGFLVCAAGTLAAGKRRWGWAASDTYGVIAAFSLIALAGALIRNRIGPTSALLAAGGAALAFSGAAALHSERMAKLRRMRRTVRSVLVRLSRSLFRIHDDARLYETVVDTLAAHSGSGICSFFLLDGRGAAVKKTVSRGTAVSPAALNRIRNHAAWSAALGREAFLRRRGRPDLEALFDAASADWLVAVRGESRLFGALALGSGVSADDMPLIVTVANQMAAALENNTAIRRSNAMVRRLTEAKVREKVMADLERTNRSLADKNSRLRRLVAEVRNAQDRLIQSEKMASLGKLVAGVSHELNNPVGFIYANVRQLRSMSDGLGRLLADPRRNAGRIRGLLPEIESLIADTESGSRMVKDLVDQLRRFSHVDRAAWSVADTHEGLDGALLILRHEIEDRVTVHRVYGPDGRIECQPGSLNQVFLNLIANAVQAVSPGGNIWVATRRLKNRLEIEVRDDGRGIPAEVLGRIFDPFFTTREIGKGTGLGLSISYAIVRSHGGSIRAESGGPGKGSRFIVTLPVRRPGRNGRTGRR